MLWFAGLLGLMGIGGAALLDFSAETAENEDDTVSSDPDTTIMPADALLDGSDNSNEDHESSGTDQGLAICDFIEDEDADEAGDTPTSISLFSGPPLSGSNSTDFISGTEVGDHITGLDGDDQLNGYEGNDSVEGGEGDDTLYGQDGADNLIGGEGDDSLHGDYGDDSLEGGEGDDSLFGHFGKDTLQGGEGDDSGHGGQDSDLLIGEGGNDALHGNDGDDTLQGGVGQDSLFGGFGDDLVWGADDGSDTDYLNGGAGEDTLVAGAGDIVSAGEGADEIWVEDLAGSGDAVQLMDYDPAEDQLVVFWSPDSEAEPVIEVDNGDPDQQIIRVNGSIVMRLTGAEGLTAEDIALVDSHSTSF